TSHGRNGAARTGAMPCHEFSGVVVSIGRNVRDLDPGLEVYGMNDWYAEGALAEYCTAPAGALAPKPARLSCVEAAAVPISALTAWQGLVDRAKLQPGEKVLIHGGAGAVGIFAIQLARLRGAKTFTTVSARNREFAKSAGADVAIDYRAERFEDVCGAVDVVFDTVGGDTLRRSWAVLKRDYRMVTIVSSEAASPDSRVNKAFFIVEPNRGQLKEVADLLGHGQLRVFLDTVVPFEKAVGAYRGEIARTGRGKIVVEMTGIRNAKSEE
ncbi:MAG: NADP-dependent oxidoreductase, partial [Acidobacteriota bacterium]|nr:NADP-dependent oxidoreductase [Acidobacteriota bacterium]